MNKPQTRFVTLSVMKVTNTEHTAIITYPISG